MLTPAGWGVLLGSVPVLAAGRILGVYELFLCGTAGIAVAVLSLLWVWVRRLRLRVDRTLTPSTVAAGSASRVDLSITNRSKRTTPVLRMRDAVSGTRGADVLLAPLASGESARAAYRLPTERRGIVEVGPLRLTVSDPFGLARSRLTAAGLSHLTVYPVVHRVAALPHRGGADPHAGAQHPNALGRSGEDFYALRPYVVGDDLRRVHWPATARHDQLMIRQDELPWQSRLTVLLDNRAELGTEASLDLAVSIAASLLNAAFARGDLARVISADGDDIGYANGHVMLDAVMGYLATVGTAATQSLEAGLERAVASGNHGTLVFVSANPSGHDSSVLGGVARHFSQIVSVVIDRSACDPTVAEAAQPSNRRWITVSRSAPFPGVWDVAMASSASTPRPLAMR